MDILFLGMFKISERYSIIALFAFPSTAGLFILILFISPFYFSIEFFLAPAITFMFKINFSPDELIFSFSFSMTFFSIFKNTFNSLWQIL